MTTLILGATGNQGGATARRLLAERRPVRALVRDTTTDRARALADAGVELRRGDLDDPASLRAALDGATAVFAIPPVAVGPNGFDGEREAVRGRAVIDAAVAAGVDQVVFSTVASTSTTAQSAAGKAEIEQYLHERVARPTVLRPVRFMTNYLAYGLTGLEGIVDGVHRHVFAPDEPMQIIALEDIAEFAAMALADPDRFGGRTLELAGDQPTPVEAAALITEATGVPVRYHQISDDEAAAINPVVLEYKKRARAGQRWHADIEALRVIHPGLRTLGDWLAEGGAAAIRAALKAEH
jgi:uncharacterized protein YbjT (DUF2867 family)